MHRLTHDLAELVGPEVSAPSPQGRFLGRDGGRAAADRRGRVRQAPAARRRQRRQRSRAPGDAREVAALRPGDGPGLPQVRLRLAVPELAWDLIAPGTCELLDAAGWAKLVRGCRR